MITGIVNLHARGAGYVHDLDIVITTSDSMLSGNAEVRTQAYGSDVISERTRRFEGGAIIVPVLCDTRINFTDPDNQNGYTNVLLNATQINGPAVDFTVTFDTLPSSEDVQIGQMTPRLYVRNTEEYIDLSTRDEAGRPYALLVPTDWQHPTETTDIGLAYPEIITYMTSGGITNANWYNTPATGRTFIPTTRWPWLPPDNNDE